MPDHCLVYVSRSSELLDENDLATILLQARNHNKPEGITGVLLCLHGRIIQVLEGEKSKLDSLYERIQRDPRHMNVTTLLSQSIDQRLFSSWNMGYETLTSSQLEEFTIIVNLNKKNDTVFSQHGTTIFDLLKSFYDTNKHG